MKTAAQTPKDARIDLRVSVPQKALLEMAAATQGKKLSEFVLAASTEAAQLVLADQDRFVLSEDQMARFLEHLEEEPRNVAQLRTLFARKRVFE